MFSARCGAYAGYEVSYAGPTPFRGSDFAAILRRMSLAATSATTTLTDDDVADLRVLVAVNGLTAAARMLGMTREPIARELAGIACRAGTRALLRERLTALRGTAGKP